MSQRWLLEDYQRVKCEMKWNQADEELKKKRRQKNTKTQKKIHKKEEKFLFKWLHKITIKINGFTKSIMQINLILVFLSTV